MFQQFWNVNMHFSPYGLKDEMPCTNEVIAPPSIMITT